MSAEATGWVFRYSPATGATFAVHLSIADSVNDQHDNEFWMRLSRLAEKARCNRGTAQRAVKWLLDHDLIELLDESRQTTGRSVRYRFLMPELPVLYDPAPSRAVRDLYGDTSRTTREDLAHHARP